MKVVRIRRVAESKFHQRGKQSGHQMVRLPAWHPKAGRRQSRDVGLPIPWKKPGCPLPALTVRCLRYWDRWWSYHLHMTRTKRSIRLPPWEQVSCFSSVIGLAADGFLASHLRFLAQAHAFFHATPIPQASLGIFAAIQKTLHFCSDFLAFRGILLH